MARTGLMISSLLLYLKLFPTAEESIDYYNQKRCIDGKGLVLPSQIVNACLEDFGCTDVHTGLNLPLQYLTIMVTLYLYVCSLFNKEASKNQRFVGELFLLAQSFCQRIIYFDVTAVYSESLIIKQPKVEYDKTAQKTLKNNQLWGSFSSLFFRFS
ncbi:Phosphatidylinositol 3,5-trisphosphate 3-phosphatase anddual-specificity protein phosphatase PTEN [Striga asiatica]|uniref:Phosphatidylinositol 3,5-trisphosphate 3-phosphatase anddual-specificity protein phosphatase PTEN n=1 Tax=Striga asiatica TaxID=4170 RepID=A0A5A7PYM5_STRAF|nr:Phosphatidylinositol 3,5-trisphosphate 3-phosphatase anddual-specificity protein phosphatase PTEN [Striga asiatica]